MEEDQGRPVTLADVAVDPPVLHIEVPADRGAGGHGSRVPYLGRRQAPLLRLRLRLPQGALEAVPGGWGIGGHAHTDKKIVRTARKLLGKD